MRASESGADCSVTVGRWQGWHWRISPEVRATIANHTVVQYNMKEFSRFDRLRNVKRWPQLFDKQKSCECQCRVRVITWSSDHMRYGSSCIILNFCNTPLFSIDDMYHWKQEL